MGTQNIRTFRQNRPESVQQATAGTRKEQRRKVKAKKIAFRNLASDSEDGDGNEHEYEFEG